MRRPILHAPAVAFSKQTSCRATAEEVTVSAVPPVRHQVQVSAGPAAAFEVFAGRIGQWWPLGDHGVYGPGGSVGFVDGKIVESSPGGDKSVWGTVTRWEPGAAVAFTWHPGGAPQRATQVEVTFQQAATGSVVTLEHEGWDVLSDPAKAREEYDLGWPGVLERYRDEVERTSC
jgi:hypothetical protein